MSYPPKQPQLNLLIAIPCLNEAQTIANVIRQIPRVIEGVNQIDVIVIDDGSTDATQVEARAAGAKIIAHSVNRGVGAAFQSAIAYAIENGYDLMVNMDGDEQFSPADISKLVGPVLAGAAHMATASRFKDPALVPNMPPVKLVGNRMMSFLISRLVRAKYADVSCGFRCYSREALLRLNLHGAFTYTQETFLDFAVKNLNIVEVPIVVRYFADRKSRVAGSIFRYAINSASIIFRGYRDYYPLRFFFGIAFAFAVPSAVLGLIFLAHFLLTGTFTGFLFAGLLSGFLFVVATLFLILGVVTDMLDRIRANQERILYILRKNAKLAKSEDREPL